MAEKKESCRPVALALNKDTTHKSPRAHTGTLEQD